MKDALFSVVPTGLVMVIGLMAAWITIYPPKAKMNKKIWAVVFVVLSVVAFVILIKVQQINDTNTARANRRAEHSDSISNLTYRDMAYLKGQLNTLAILTADKNKVNGSQNTDIAKELANSFDRFSKGINQISGTRQKKEPLKKRALRLSKDMLTFISNRKKDHDEILKRDNAGTFEKLVKDLTYQDNETMRLYSVSFKSDVIEINDEFDKIGIKSHNPEYDIELKYAINVMDIESLAYEIAAMAKRLP
ncbi:hypothetical protein BH09BAC6_BH09BAC6_08710 [soil metagenome]|jgi:predicted lactoylglutathione lyase